MLNTQASRAAKEADAHHASPQDATREALRDVPNGLHRVSALSDAEREKHIRDCGYLMEDAMRRWCETGDFGYRGEADRWRRLMEEAIRSRSPAQVAKLERERGLA